jgi:DNA-binding protein YbaB
LDGYQRRVRDLARQAATAQAELAAVAATESSPDGSVTLTVNCAGALTGLTIGRPAEGLSRVQLAAAILATAQRAHAEAAARMAEVMRPLLGERSAAMTLLRAQLPDPDPDAGTSETHR